MATADTKARGFMVGELLPGSRPREGAESTRTAISGAALRLGLWLAVALAGFCLHPGAAQAQGMRRSAPSQTYFVLFGPYYEGEYRDALKDYLSEGRSAIKNGPGNNWIDSICYHTMVGECHYQMGRHTHALAQYTSALNLYLKFSDWFLRLQFPPGIQPAGQGQVKRVPWGASQRGALVGYFPDTTLSGQGQINNNDVVQRGGVVQLPVLYPVYAQEIVRCTCLAMRRRRELLGPACQHDPLSAQLVTALSRRPGPPNHWSEAWIDVQLGLALSSAGKDAQAKGAFERAVVAGGQYDHPLTSTALLELGRMALAGGDFASAENYFGEATYAAVNFSDPGLLEEAFRFGLLTHLMGNREGLYPPLLTAPAWARVQGFRQLQASLLVMAGENYCSLGEAQAAATALANARTAIGRRDMLAGKVGARLNYATALSLYQLGNAVDGDAALAAALAFQRVGSIWLFHINMADDLWVNEGITDRVAMDLYTAVLRDPTPADWATDPLESLSSLIAPHHLAIEHWFEVALERKEHERALEIADQLRRHRFLSTLDLGGRLLALRWVLEGPAEMLDQQATLQRQNLLVRYPAYEQLSQQVRQLRNDLGQMPLAPEDGETSKQQAAKLAELASLSLSQETILREIALRREPCDMVFPPRRTTKEVQKTLPEGHALLAFLSTSRNLYAFLMTRDKYGYWPVAVPKSFSKQIMLMLRDWGNYEQNKEMSLAELKSDKWKKPAREILEVLMKDSKADVAQTFQELVIVPDGALWYVPFEALLIPDGDEARPLIGRLRIRYAPTVGLGIADPRPRKQSGHTAVVLGKLFPRDENEVAEAAFDDLGRVVPGAESIRGKLPAPSAVYSSLFDRMIVYSDISPSEGGAYNWSPVQLDRGAPGSALAQWFALPFSAPDQVILPGFHTGAENGMKGLSADNMGADLFLSVCGLMSTGARTVLISRWRTGGQTSFDLVREFAQELPHATASEAWQRSVLLVSNNQLNPELEPRLKLEGTQEPPLADHPFFWAGYLLADTGSSPHGKAPEPAADEVAAKRPGADEKDKPKGIVDADDKAELKPRQPKAAKDDAEPDDAKADEAIDDGAIDDGEGPVDADADDDAEPDDGGSLDADAPVKGKAKRPPAKKLPAKKPPVKKQAAKPAA